MSGRVAKKRKVFVAKVVALGKSVPDFGLGKGVLGIQRVQFTDTRGWGFDNSMFAAAMVRAEEKIIRDTVKVEWEEEKPKRRK